MAKHEGRFPWGRVIERHEIGDHDIIEYHPYITNSSKIDESKREFSIRLKGGCYTSATSLDAALIAAICIKHDGPNTRFPEYILKALGMEG